MNFKPLIEAQYKSMCEKQIAKNEDYGNSAFEDIEVMEGRYQLLMLVCPA